MQISLKKIHESAKPFKIEEESVEFYGNFRRTGKHTVAIDGRLKGELELFCDRCGESFRRDLDESFSIEAVDRPVKVEESLDMIECLDGIVDFDSICKSEIAAIESEYHLCPKCEEEDDFEIEI